jgi:hypothetical protein
MLSRGLAIERRHDHAKGDMLKRRQQAGVGVGAVALGLTIAGAGALSGDVTEMLTRAPRGFNVDLAFKFDCNGGAYPISDERVERFLTEKELRSQICFGSAGACNLPHPFDFLIEGADREQRIVRFASRYQTGWRSVGWYFVGLFSRPPTKHEQSFEGEIFAFVTNTLGCKLRDMQRDARHWFAPFG